MGVAETVKGVPPHRPTPSRAETAAQMIMMENTILRFSNGIVPNARVLFVQKVLDAAGLLAEGFG